MPQLSLFASAVILVLFTGALGWASKDTVPKIVCDQLMESAGAARGIHSFPPATSAELPEDFIKVLMSHPEVQSLKRFGSGNKYSIHIHHAGSVGLQAQEVFLKKVLQLLFPDADLWANPYLPSQGRKLHFTLTDFGLNSTLSPSLKHISMPIVKMLNPGPGLTTQDQVRSALSIPLIARVISLNNAVENSRSQIEDLLHHLKRLKPDYVLVSQAQRDGNPLSEASLQAKLGTDWKLVALSSLGSEPLDANFKYVVYNDVRGKMHVVYKASDLNVTAGSVNLAEPLLALTPTIFFTSASSYMHDYDKAIFDQMADMAIRSRGGVGVSCFDEMVNEAQKILNRPVPVPITPPWKLEWDGEKILDRFLREFRVAFEYVEEDPPTKAYQAALNSDWKTVKFYLHTYKDNVSVYQNLAHGLFQEFPPSGERRKFQVLMIEQGTPDLWWYLINEVLERILWEQLRSPTQVDPNLLSLIQLMEQMAHQHPDRFQSVQSDLQYLINLK